MENQLFNTYVLKLEKLKSKQKKLPRSLRLFNIRIRLAIDIEINFKGENSLTKTKNVRETYIQIIKLMEMWNAYEALSHYAKDVSSHVNKGVTKSRIYTQEFLKKVGSLQILNNTLEVLKLKYDESDKFEVDFKQYVERINTNKHLTSSTLKDDAKSVLLYFQEQKSIHGIEILSLIYAERNMYYHNGEAAKMGMLYSNRKYLIEKYIDVLREHTLKLAIYIINEQIINIQK